MSKHEHGWTDERVEQIISILLRSGVITAAGIVLIAGILYLIRHGASSPHYGVFHGEPADLRSVSKILTSALSLRSRDIIQLGILLLIATPVARVAFSLLAFTLQRDRIYILVTSIVLGVLLYSLGGGWL